MAVGNMKPLGFAAVGTPANEIHFGGGISPVGRVRNIGFTWRVFFMKAFSHNYRCIYEKVRYDLGRWKCLMFL